MESKGYRASEQILDDAGMMVVSVMVNRPSMLISDTAAGAPSPSQSLVVMEHVHLEAQHFFYKHHMQ